MSAFSTVSQGENVVPIENVVSIRDILGVLWRRLWVIALVVIVFTGTALGFDLMRTPIYEASVKILVSQDTDQANPGNLGSNVQGLQEITQTMARAVATRPVAESAIEQLDLGMDPEALLQNMDARQDATTQFIDVSYRDPSPEQAQQVANAIGELFSGRLQTISPSTNGVNAMVWEPAATPTDPVTPKPLRDAAIAFGLAVMLGVALALLLEHLDDRWRSPEEVEEVSGAPTFGAVPTFKLLKNGKGEN